MQRCDTPLLLAATRCAIDLAEVRGWSAATLTGVFYGLKAVLDGHAGGGPVPLSQVRQRARPRRHSSATRIAEVLAELALLHDDTTAAIRTWINGRTGDLPAGFGCDVCAWLMVLLDGDARTRPRSHATLRVHFGIVRPFIECWAATRSHLREVTSGDVDAVLEPLRGHRRYNAITAPRSLFRFAKRRGLTFADPTRHLSGGRVAGRTVLPMTAEEFRAAGQAAVTPAQRLAIALAAVHAARPKAIRELTLDDIDLPSRRITLAGHQQPLGELTRSALLAWLDYGVPPGQTPPTGMSWSRASAPWAPGRFPLTTSTSTSRAASPWNASGATASCRKPWPPVPTPSTSPWSSTSTTPTRWPTPAPPATFSAAQPNRPVTPRHEGVSLAAGRPRLGRSVPMVSLSQAVPVGPMAGIRAPAGGVQPGPGGLSPARPALMAAPRRRGRMRSCPVPAGLPVTDRGQAPPLLGCGPGVEPVAALLEVADDALPVLDGVGVVVLELGVHPQHRQPDAADAGQHPPVRRRAGSHGGVAALGLEIGELGGEDLRLALGVVDHGGPAPNCTAA